MKTRAVLLVLVAVLASLVLSAGAEDQPFPHETHQGLFPAGCTTCHGGIASGDTARAVTVTPKGCAHCHNGDLLDHIPWKGWTPIATNVVFDHELHVKENGIECNTCHQLPGTDESMSVGPPNPEACLGCHDAPAHLSPDNDCAMCHVPLTQAKGLSAAQIAAFPAFPGHDQPGWLAKHQSEAKSDIQRCAICHARNDCEICHTNANEVAAIQKLGTDPRTASRAEIIEPKGGKPASHLEPKWLARHGKEAWADAQTCASCHDQVSCRRCHLRSKLAPILALPSGDVSAPKKN